MQNRLKQLPLNVQKHVYEIAGMAGTICSNCTSEEYNHAMGAFLFATPEDRKRARPDGPRGIRRK